MATWGSWVNNSTYGSIRLGYDLSRTGVDYNTTSVTWYLTIYLEAQYSIADTSNSFSLSGSWSNSGSKTINTPSGGGTVTLYSGSVTTYGGSGTTHSVSFNSSISGVYQYNNTASVSGSGSVYVDYPPPPPISVPTMGSTTATAGVGYIDVAWSVSNNGGAGIEEYQVYKNNTLTWTYGSGTTSLRDTVGNGVSASYYVRARNSAGWSGNSNTASATTPNIPGVPASISSTPNNGSITVTYGSAPNNGSAITSYQYSLDNSTWTTTPSNPFNVTGPNGTAITVYVRGVNAVGAGSSVNTTSTPRTLPLAPQSFSADSSTFGQLSLSWSAPSSDGGSPITAYVLTRSDGTVLQNNLTTSYIDPNLQTNTEYSYNVRAVNVVGSSSNTSLTAKTVGGIANIKTSTGYQKVIPKVKVNGVWVDAQARVFDNGQWKYGV